ncbi:hypothetical protein MRX96_005845 [Rhipicephalus microplus]
MVKRSKAPDSREPCPAMQVERDFWFTYVVAASCLRVRKNCQRPSLSVAEGESERDDSFFSIGDVAAPHGSAEEEVMDVSGGASGTTIRVHDATQNAGEAPSVADLEGPPTESVTFRRPKFKPRPNLPSDREAVESLPK